MKDITKEIESAAAEAVKEIYQVDLSPGDFLVTSTKKEHKGDYTLVTFAVSKTCLLYTSPSPRDRTRSRMPSSA